MIIYYGKELSRVPRLLSESYNSGLVERLYDSGGSVMLDIIIYLCGNHIRDLFGESWFSIEDFVIKWVIIGQIFKENYLRNS